MPERAALLQATQIGIETTPGTAVAANKRLTSVSFNPGIMPELQTFKPVGSKFASISVLNKEWMEYDLDGVLDYNAWSYLMALGVAYAAPVQQGSTAAYKWTGTPANYAEDTRKTATIEFGGAVRAERSPYGILTSLGYSISRTETKVKGTAISRRIEDPITLTASPTDVPLQPVQATEVCVFADDTAAGLGTTKLTRNFTIDFNYGDSQSPVWPIDCALTGFAATVDGEPKTTLELLVAADAQGFGFLANMRAGSKKFIRVLATGPMIATPYTYLWQHDMCVVVSGVDKFEDHEGVYAMKWKFEVSQDSTWGKAMEWQVTNPLTAL